MNRYHMDIQICRYKMDIDRLIDKQMAGYKYKWIDRLFDNYVHTKYLLDIHFRI